MLHYPLDPGDLPSEGRQQPWTTSNHHSPGQYYDFRESPDLIPNVLEEFVPWAQYPAIETFYDLIRWLNGPDSRLETSDCMFQGVTPNPSMQISKRLQVVGRFMIFNRDLEWNTNRENIDWLKVCISHHLRVTDPQFQCGCVAMGPYETRYMEISGPPLDQAGWQMILKFWSWGNGEKECMVNLDRTFSNTRTVMEAVSTDISNR